MWNFKNYKLNSIKWKSDFNGAYLTLYTDVEIAFETDDIYEEIQVGNIAIYIFNNQWSDMLTTSEGISPDIYSVVHQIVAAGKDSGNIAVLDLFYIKEAFTGKGLGTDLLQQIERYLEKVMMVKMIGLVAEPIRSTTGDFVCLDSNDKKEQLYEWYAKRGYVRFGRFKDHICKIL